MILASSYLKHLKETLDIIQSYRLKTELGLEDYYKSPKKESVFIDEPRVVITNNKIEWYLLTDLSINVSDVMVDRLHLFVEYMEKNSSLNGITTNEALLKKDILTYITNIGLS